jgi:soluble lytic murein transglycosylase-like protein
MTAPENQGRRAADREREQDTAGPAGDGDRRRGDRRTSGDRRTLLQRYRQPLIGLGLAGMALPMVRATPGPADETPEAEPEQAGSEVASAAGAADTEEALAEQIAMTQAEEARQEQVQEAVERYGIAEDLAEDIYDIAREASIEPKLAYGLIKTESTFNERAVSPVGARGLTQVMPRTAAWLVPGTRTQDLYDRETNLRLGFTYLNQMIDKYKGDVRLALLAYNRGPGTVDRVLKRGGNPDNGYADKVLRG